MAANRHFERTAPRSRLWKRSILRLNLICPNTGSISLWRLSLGGKASTRSMGVRHRPGVHARPCDECGRVSESTAAPPASSPFPGRGDRGSASSAVPLSFAQVVDPARRVETRARL